MKRKNKGRALLDTLESVDVRFIKRSQWPNVKFSPLWWAGVRYYNGAVPVGVSHLAVYLSEVTGTPAEYFESVALVASHETEPIDMKRATIKEMRRLLRL